MKNFWGVAPLVAAILGFVTLCWAFVTGIGAALEGSGSGALPFEVVFIIAALVVVAAFVTAVVNLVRGRFRALSVITMVIAILPLLGIVALRLAAL